MEIDKLLQQIRTAGLPKEGDEVELHAILQNKVLQRALYSLLNESDMQMTHLVNSDLSTDENVRRAIKTQSFAQAYSAVVEDLVEAAKPKPTEEEKED